MKLFKVMLLIAISLFLQKKEINASSMSESLSYFNLTAPVPPDNELHQQLFKTLGEEFQGIFLV